MSNSFLLSREDATEHTEHLPPFRLTMTMQEAVGFGSIVYRKCIKYRQPTLRHCRATSPGSTVRMAACGLQLPLQPIGCSVGDITVALNEWCCCQRIVCFVCCSRVTFRVTASVTNRDKVGMPILEDGSG